jgi:hypothetical protein
VELDTGGMDAAELAWAARFAARLADHWPEDHHQATRALFSELAGALTRCQVDLVVRIAAIETGQIDSLSMRMRLGMVAPRDEPVRLGWIDVEPPDD